MTATTTSHTSATAEQVVAEIVQRELIASAVIRFTISDYTSWVKPGANQVKIPKTGSFSVQDKAAGSATGYQALQFATDNLDLNKHKHIPALLEDSAQAQSAVDLTGEYVERMASAFAKQIDVDIYNQLKLCASANNVTFTGSSGSKISKDDILAARAKLDAQEVPAGDRYMLVNPKQEAEMLAIEGFVDASKYGSSDPVQNGELGRVYGFRVIKSTVCEEDVTIFYHRSHVAFAMQQMPKYERQRASLTALGDELSLSTLYGCKVLDGGKRGSLATAAGGDGGGDGEGEGEGE